MTHRHAPTATAAPPGSPGAARRPPDAAGPRPARAPAPPAAPVRRRGAVRRFLEARGTIGGHRARHFRRRLRAADGVWLSAVWLPGPAAARPTAEVPAVVLAHGFAASAAKPAYARLADELQHHATVLALDLRGHGRSRGASTLGDAEHHDVAAAVAALRADGHVHVTVVGVSMGSTAAVHASVNGARPDALVLVSGPGWLHPEPRTEPLRHLHRHLHSPVSRAVLRLALRVRVAPPGAWRHARHPADLVPAKLPVLVVHGRDDAYFPVGDAEALAAGARSVLWLEDGFGHAEDGLSRGFCRRLAAALATVAATDGFPSGSGRAS